MGGSAYLGDPKLLEDKCPVVEEKDFLNSDIQLHALTHCAARLVNDTAALLAERVTTLCLFLNLFFFVCFSILGNVKKNKSSKTLLQVGAGRSLGDSWNDALIEIYRISRAHSIYSVANAFISTLFTDIKESHPALFPVLKKLSDLYGKTFLVLFLFLFLFLLCYLLLFVFIIFYV